MKNSCAPPRNRDVTYSEFLTRLLRAQWHHRQEIALEYRIRRANLPERWSLETFPFDRQPGVSRKQIRSFAELDFLAKAEHLIFIGPTAVGKTGLVLLFINTITYYCPFVPPPCYACFGRALICQEKARSGSSLPKQERKELERRANKYTLPYFIVARAKMILAADDLAARTEAVGDVVIRKALLSEECPCLWVDGLPQ